MKQKILELLRDAGAISESTVEVIKTFATTWNCSGYAALIETHVFDEAQLADTLAAAMKIDRIYNIAALPIRLEVLSRIPWKLALKYQCLPLGFQVESGKPFEIVVADPTDYAAQESLRVLLACDLSLAVGERSDIVNAINGLYPVEMQLPSLGVVHVRRSADGS